MVLALLGATTLAHAGGTVGSGTPASCTAAALVQALAGGGTVTFDCGTDPHTIVLAQRQTIAADTTIAGDGRIDLSGGGAHGVLTVQTGRTLTLDHVGIRDGAVDNWALYVSNGAALRLAGVTVQDCTRGGVYNAGGTVTVADSTFTNIDATVAGAALTNENGGSLTVERTTFHANLNGAVFGGGPTTITDSVFTSNVGDSGGGGALLHSKDVTVTRSRFEGNSASGGGAIYGSANLVVENSVFHGNAATIFDGGAIQLFNQTQTPSSVTVRRSTFSGNVAKRSGGAVRCDAPMGGCTLENVTFSDDGADEGAAEISLKSGAASVTHATVVASDTPAIERVAGTLTLKNSVVDGGACAGTFTDGGGNVQSTPGLCAPGFATGDPAFGELDDHGGWTPTFALGDGSAALGAATGCLPTDQRGVARPATCDAGAFQRGAVPTLLSLTPSRTKVGGPAFTMIVTGASFLAGPTPTRALWNGMPLPSIVSSPTELVVSVPAELIAAVGVANVTVENPNPPVSDGGPSATSLPFTIDEGDDDVPPPPPPPPPPPSDPVGPCDGLTSFAAVLCAIDQARTPGHFCAAADLDAKLDRPLQTALGKAATFVGAARNATTKKRPKLLRKAKAQLEKVARRAGGKKAGATTATCKAAVVDGARALAGDVAGLAQ
jgi:predicted outer membrane repeat protein